MQFCYKPNNNQENANNLKEDDNYAFAMQHETYQRPCISGSQFLEAMKYMVFQKVTFDTYKAFAPYNVYLNDDSIVEAIGMSFIIIEILVKDKTKRFLFNDALFISKLQENLLSVSKILPNRLIVKFNLNECILKLQMEI